MRGEFLDLSDARIYYYAAGQRGAGEPVVFIHGFPTSSHLWNDVVPLIPRGNRIVVLDLLGYGRSDRPLQRSLSIQSHAARVIELFDTLGIQQACIVGHHLGGAIAQALALRYPRRVSRLCLVDSIAFDRGLTPRVRVARALNPLRSELPPGLLMSILRSDFLRGYSDRDRGKRSMDLYLRPFATADGRDALMRHLRALDLAEVTELGRHLGEIAIPSTIVWGGDDQILPPSLATRLKGAIPDSTLEIVDGGGHFVPEEAPERVAAAVAALLSR